MWPSSSFQRVLSLPWPQSPPQHPGHTEPLSLPAVTAPFSLPTLPFPNNPFPTGARFTRSKLCLCVQRGNLAVSPSDHPSGTELCAGLRNSSGMFGGGMTDMGSGFECGDRLGHSK